MTGFKDSCEESCKNCIRVYEWDCHANIVLKLVSWKNTLKGKINCQESCQNILKGSYQVRVRLFKSRETLWDLAKIPTKIVVSLIKQELFRIRVLSDLIRFLILYLSRGILSDLVKILCKIFQSYIKQRVIFGTGVLSDLIKFLNLSVKRYLVRPCQAS